MSTNSPILPGARWCLGFCDHQGLGAVDRYVCPGSEDVGPHMDPLIGADIGAGFVAAVRVVFPESRIPPAGVGEVLNCPRVPRPGRVGLPPVEWTHINRLEAAGILGDSIGGGGKARASVGPLPLRRLRISTSMVPSSKFTGMMTNVGMSM